MARTFIVTSTESKSGSTNGKRVQRESLWKTLEKMNKNTTRHEWGSLKLKIKWVHHTRNAPLPTPHFLLPSLYATATKIGASLRKVTDCWAPLSPLYEGKLHPYDCHQQQQDKKPFTKTTANHAQVTREDPAREVPRRVAEYPPYPITSYVETNTPRVVRKSANTREHRKARILPSG